MDESRKKQDIYFVTYMTDEEVKLSAQFTIKSYKLQPWRWKITERMKLEGLLESATAASCFSGRV